MKLEPQDIVVLLKIAKYADGRPPYSQIAAELFLSTSRVHASVRRAKAARLLHGSELGERPNYAALEEFLIHGVKYAFPAQRGEMSRGLPTAFAAAPHNEWITPSDEPPPVWPFVSLLDKFGFPDANIIDRFVAMNPRADGLKDWASVLTSYRGATIHEGYMDFETKHDATDVVRVCAHLKDVIARLVFKEVGYGGTYESPLLRNFGPQPIDWVQSNTTLTS